MAAEATTTPHSTAGSEPARPIKRYARLAPLYKGLIWTSFLINAVLLIVVGVLAGVVITQYRQINALAQTIPVFAGDNIAELQDVVTQLEGATIRATIPLSQSLSLAGKGIVVPVDQTTEVILTEPVPLQLAGADIDLGGGNSLRAQNIGLTLPEGTPLRIALKMNIPLDSVTIPVVLDVPVTIPLKDTELGPQFRRLGAVVQRLVTPVEDLLVFPDTPPDSSKP